MHVPKPHKMAKMAQVVWGHPGDQATWSPGWVLGARASAIVLRCVTAPLRVSVSLSKKWKRHLPPVQVASNVTRMCPSPESHKRDCVLGLPELAFLICETCWLGDGDGEWSLSLQAAGGGTSGERRGQGGCEGGGLGWRESNLSTFPQPGSPRAPLRALETQAQAAC